MNGWYELGTLWDWSSLAWFGAAILLAVMVGLFLRSPGLRGGYLAAAIVAFLAAFLSPIGVLASGYLFTAHIIQHLLLLLIVPLFLVLSISQNRPPHADSEAAPNYPRLLGNPIFGWVCGLGAMWFWHIPSLCSAATTDWTIGAIRDTSFLLAGAAFWWPIFAPRNADRLAPPNAIVYLFSACLGCTLLGIYITFTTVSVCPVFANSAARMPLLPFKLYDVGLTPMVDQQLGGLMMWIPPCSLYVSVILALFARWYTVPGPVARSLAESP